jgi:hypothetical protein
LQHQNFCRDKADMESNGYHTTVKLYAVCEGPGKQPPPPALHIQAE